MNTRILLLALSVVALSSCSSVYKSGQTPDDVYYSPARPQAPASDDEYVDVRQPKQGANYQTYEQYQDNYRDDRFLRMSVGNPYYMNAYNSYGGFDWRYNSFYDGFNYGFTSPWNNYFAWNNFYNPYCVGYGYGGNYGLGYHSGGYGSGYYGGTVKYTNYNAPISRPVVFNVNSYSGNNRAGARSYTPSSYYNNPQRYNNGNGANNNRSYYNNGNSNSNNSRNNSYTPANNTGSSNNSNNNYTPSRSYTPSSSGSSSGGSSSGGGGGSVSRPTRGN